MKRYLLPVLKYILFIFIGAFLFWLAIKDQNVQGIWNELLQANYVWVALSLVAMFISHIFRSLRWKMLLESGNYKVRASTSIYAVFIGYFANLAVPRLGEITRCGVISGKDNVPVNSVIGTVVVERVFDIICMVVIFLLIIFTQLDLVGTFVSKNIINPIGEKFETSTLVMISAGLVLGFAGLLWLFFKVILPRLKKLKFYYRILRLWAGFIVGLKSIKNVRNLPAFIFQSFMIWFLYSLTIYCLFFSMKDTAHLTFIDAITIMIMGALGVIVPTPGGIGAYQFIVSKAMAEIFAVPALAAVTFSNISYFSQWLLLLFAGLASLLIMSFQKRNKIIPKN